MPIRGAIGLAGFEKMFNVKYEAARLAPIPYIFYPGLNKDVVLDCKDDHLRITQIRAISFKLKSKRNVYIALNIFDYFCCFRLRYPRQSAGTGGDDFLVKAIDQNRRFFV